VGFHISYKLYKNVFHYNSITNKNSTARIAEKSNKKAKNAYILKKGKINSFISNQINVKRIYV
jgi:hypothetical protein